MAQRQRTGSSGIAADQTATVPADAPERRTWTIGELAAEFDTTLRTIRFYEDSGLLSPERQGQRRVFHPRDRVRLRLIMRGRRLGFALDEIATIIDMYDAEPGEEGQLDYLVEQVQHRRRELEGRRRDIDDAIAELDALEDRCRADLDVLRRRPADNPAPPPAHPPARRP